MDGSALQRTQGRRLGEQLCQRQLEHLAQRDERGQPGVERRARTGLALLQLLVGVAGDPGEVGSALLAQAALLARALQAYADVSAVLLPGRSLPLSCHAPIVVAGRRGAVIPVWESADERSALWTSRRSAVAMSVALPKVADDTPGRRSDGGPRRPGSPPPRALPVVVSPGTRGPRPPRRPAPPEPRPRRRRRHRSPDARG